jgi:hypothetical protein
VKDDETIYFKNSFRYNICLYVYYFGVYNDFVLENAYFRKYIENMKLKNGWNYLFFNFIAFDCFLMEIMPSYNGNIFRYQCYRRMLTLENFFISVEKQKKTMKLKNK